jgi:predicted RecA/RadA family phage recombinase
MADAIALRPASDNRITLENAVASGEVRQLANGRAAVCVGLNAHESGDTANFSDVGKYTMTKATGIALLDGGRAYWDHSANAVTFRKVNDRDFYLGTIVGDATSSDATCVVDLNKEQSPTIDLLRDGALSVATGTAAAGGFGLPPIYGGVPGLRLTGTSEAQCVDLLSVDRVAVNSNPIAEFVVRVGANGSTSDVDINFGLANGTSTTDADAVTEHVFFHIDGGSTDIRAQSKDGTTTVNATDTTVDFSVGSSVANRCELWIDARNPADVQLYVDGVNVLPNTVFRLDAATGPLGLLAHVEKTSGTATAGPVYIDRAILRTAEQ